MYIFLACGENKVVKVSTAGRIMVKSSVVSQAAFFFFLQSMVFDQRSKMNSHSSKECVFPFSLSISVVLFHQGCVDVATSPSLSIPHHVQVNVDWHVKLGLTPLISEVQNHLLWS